MNFFYNIFRGFGMYIICLPIAVLANGKSVDNLLVDQLSLFREKHPEEAARYEILAPVSVEFIEYMNKENTDDIISVLEAVKAAFKRYRNEPESFKNYIEEEIGFFKSESHEFEIRNKIKDTDRLFFFKYRYKDEYQEYKDRGYLVIRRGCIVYRNTDKMIRLGPRLREGKYFNFEKGDFINIDQTDFKEFDVDKMRINKLKSSSEGGEMEGSNTESKPEATHVR